MNRLPIAAALAALSLAACGDGTADVSDVEAGYDESAPSLEEVSLEAEQANVEAAPEDTAADEGTAE